MQDITQDLEHYIFVAFDFETTGISSHTERIIEIGAVKFQVEKKSITEELDLGVAPVKFQVGKETTFQQLVNPQMPVHPEVTKVHGINDEQLANQPVIDEVMPRFLAFIGDAVLIAHNASFDMGFLRIELNRCGLSSVQNTIVDTIALARKTFPKLGKYNLQHLVTIWNFPPNTAHRALNDAQQCKRVFERCVQEQSSTGSLLLKDLL